METPAFTVENIEKAVYQLYYDPSPEVKDTAQRWLTSAQHSREAWSFSWKLLQPGQKTEVQYFGASALMTKISRSWDEIPENDVDSLRDHIFAEILRLCVSPQDKIVLTRMCVAFASLIIKCMVAGRWQTAVSDIMTKLQDENLFPNITPMQRCSALLEILTVTAEEFHTKNLDRHPKGIVKHNLAQGMPQVLPLLLNLLSSDQFKPMHNKVLKCFSSWVVMGIPFDENINFLHLALSCLKDPELFESSVECLLQVFCSPEAYRYPNTFRSLFPNILGLRAMFHQAVKDHDADICLGLTKVVCGLAENHTKLILQNYANVELGLGLILMVAECTAIDLQYPTEEQSSPITFTFWYSLQDEIRSLPPEAEAITFPRIQPIFLHLIETLIKKSKYPIDNSHNGWSSEEKEQHRIYRVDVSDSLMFVLEMLGPHMIQFLCNNFVEAVQSTQPSAWQDLEALLFGIYSVVESTYDWENGLECLNEVARHIPAVKVDNITLADTVLYAIGALADWLVYNPRYLPALISILLPCLWTSDLALTTVLTLKRLTRECIVHIPPFASDILKTAQEALTKGVLKNMEVGWLMQSVGHVLSVVSEDECIRQLQDILMLHMHQLQALSEDQPSGPTKNSIIHILDILKSLFSTLDRRNVGNDSGDSGVPVIHNVDSKDPVLLILQQLTPILQEILNKWVRDVDIVSAICSLYDKSIRNLLDGFGPLLPTLCDTLRKIFEAAPQVTVLTLTQQITLTFGYDDQHKYPISVLFRGIIETCHRMFEGGHAESHPDLAQGFVDLLTHILKKNKNLLFSEIPGNPSLPPPDLTHLYQCAVVTFSLPESESVKSSAAFFLGLFRNSDQSKIQALLNDKGKEIYLASMEAIGGKAPRTVMDNVADILLALAKFNTKSFTSWLQESSETENFPCPNLDKSQSKLFYSGLLLARMNRGKYHELVSNFAIFCRGLYGTEYVAK